MAFFFFGSCVFRCVLVAANDFAFRQSVGLLAEYHNAKQQGVTLHQKNIGFSAFICLATRFGLLYYWIK